MNDAVSRADTARTIRLVAIAALASSMAMRIADPMLPGLATSFDARPVDMAAVITAFSLAYALLILFYGPLGDRRGKLRVIMAASFMAAAASMACALAPDFRSLVALRFVTGAACAGLIPLSLAWIGDRVAFADRQQTLARFAAASIGGLIAGQVTGGLIADTVGWRWAFLPQALLFLVAGIALLRSPATRAESRMLAAQRVANGSPPREGVLAGYRNMLGDRWVRTVMLMVGIEGACYFGAVAFVPSFLHDRLGMALWQAGLLVASIGIGGLLFSFSSAPLIARLGLTGCARMGGLTTAIGLACIVLGSNWPMAVAGCTLTGFGFTMLHNSLQTQATQMWPQSRGTALAGFVVALFGGQALGVALAAEIIPVAGYDQVMLSLAGALALLGLGYAFRLARR